MANGNIGIGTSNPLAKLHVADSNVVFSAVGDIPASPGNPPISGAGRRMMWYPDKAAFRFGYVDGANWDKDSIGTYSFASGYNSKAKGYYSIAMGYIAKANSDYSTAIGASAVANNNGSIAFGTAARSFGASAVAIGENATSSGNYALALGHNATASGNPSIAIGEFTNAGGDASTAIGFQTHANGTAATALGANTSASGFASTAMGESTLASGENATSMGHQTTASGPHSTAMGYAVTTNGFAGCLIIGDNTGVPASPSICYRANEFRARFDGGYAFYTSASAGSGVYMVNGDNAWSSISDSTKKEKFVKTDGEYVLNSIRNMRLGTWNYKTQNAKNFRHYGPMAQEFYKAFGHDAIGKIGSDTLINAADMDGVMMIALQALEKRTDKLEELLVENNRLQTQVAMLTLQVNGMQKQWQEMTNTLKTNSKENLIAKLASAKNK